MVDSGLCGRRDCPPPSEGRRAMLFDFDAIAARDRYKLHRRHGRAAADRLGGDAIGRRRGERGAVFLLQRRGRGSAAAGHQHRGAGGWPPQGHRQQYPPVRPVRDQPGERRRRRRDGGDRRRLRPGDQRGREMAGLATLPCRKDRRRRGSPTAPSRSSASTTRPSTCPASATWCSAASSAMHVADEAVLDAARCYIDTPKLDLVGRMHGRGWYARSRDQFEIDADERSRSGNARRSERARRARGARGARGARAAHAAAAAAVGGGGRCGCFGAA